MSSHVSRELMHLQRGVFPKAPRDHIEPRSAGRLVSASNSRHKLAYRSSNASRVNRPRAVLGQGSRHEACMTADPMRNGCAWNRNASEPLWIELDFNLFESDRQGRIAVGRTRAVKDGRRTVNHAPSELGLIGAVCSLATREPRTADPAQVYQSGAQSSQGPLWCASITCLETIQYTACGNPYKGTQATS